jgi:subtilisin family serine protease
MKKINVFIYLCLSGVFFSPFTFANDEFIAIITPKFKARISRGEATFNEFKIEEHFTAFEQDLVKLRAKNMQILRSLPEYFLRVEKNQTFKIINFDKRPSLPSPDELLDWNPLPVMTNDSEYSRLWGVLNYGQKLQKRGIKKMDAAIGQAWNFTKDLRSIHVGVMDTGVDFKHPDLAEKIWKTTNEYGRVVHGFNALSTTLDVTPDDYFTHGTHVAGTIASVHNNKRGIAGVAPNAIIVAVKIFSKDGATDSVAVLKGLDWIYNHPEIRVINHSYVGTENSQIMEAAFKRLDDNGVINVFGAGNSGANLDRVKVYPAAFNLKHKIVVGAHDSQGKRPSFSNYAEEAVDISAPGVDIYSPCMKTKYCSLFGTSMAAPHVTGAVAVLLAMFPELTPLQIKDKILNGGEYTPSLEGASRNAKRLNLLGAVFEGLE